MDRFKDYVIGEVFDTIRMMKLNGVIFPKMSKSRIEVIVDSIIFDWNEIGDPEEDLNSLIKWNIEQNISIG